MVENINLISSALSVTDRRLLQITPQVILKGLSVFFGGTGLTLGSSPDQLVFIVSCFLLTKQRTCHLVAF